MATVTEMTSPATPNPGVGEDKADHKPAWLLHLENELYWDEEDGSDNSRALFDILRPMLQAPSDDVNAAAEAARKIASHFLGPYLASRNPPQTEPSKDNLFIFIYRLTVNVFELASQVLFPSLEHDRLAQVLIEVHNLGPSGFGAKEIDPDFTSFEQGFGAEASERRNDDEVPDKEWDDFKAKCNIALSTATLFAKMFRANALGNHGGNYASWQLDDGLRIDHRPGRGVYPKDALPVAQEVASQWILISGEALAAEVRNPTRKRKIPLTTDLWKEWAAGFAKVAAGADGELKEHAELAHKKMIELFPELFEEEEVKAEPE